MTKATETLPPYRQSLAGTLLAAREAVMAPIRPMLREAGVTEQQWRVLRVLKDLGALDPTSLSQAALLYPPSVTRILKDLADRGLIVRESDPSDRRRSIASLTESGRTLLSETARHTVATLETYRHKFGAARLEQLTAELRALTAAIANGD